MLQIKYLSTVLSMEFPPELLSIIREFSRPAFVHWRLFNQAKSVVEARHLAPLRRALRGPHEAQVSETLKMYLRAVELRKFCENSLRTFERSIGIYRERSVWCQETRTVRQWCQETQTVVPFPVLTEEQTTMSNRWASCVLKSCNKEFTYRRELMVLVYQ